MTRLANSTPSELGNLLLQHYGATGDPRKAFFITPDGEFVNGYDSYNGFVLDHSEVGYVPSGNYSIEDELYSLLPKLVERYNISGEIFVAVVCTVGRLVRFRVTGSGGEYDIYAGFYTKPTRAQLNAILYAKSLLAPEYVHVEGMKLVEPPPEPGVELLFYKTIEPPTNKQIEHYVRYIAGLYDITK